MKKVLAIVLAINFMILCLPVFALHDNQNEQPRDTRIQPAEPQNAPLWTDYVPSKYENPRTDFTKRSAVKEIIWGAVLTDLIVTSPIGIPMLCHGTTKLKNVSYAQKKEKFFDGLEEAKNIPVAQQAEFYKNLLKECKLNKKHID